MANIAYNQKVVWTPSGGTGSITLAGAAWIVVFLTTDSGASGITCSSSIDGSFGAAKDTENDAADAQDCYAFAKYCSAGTHTITIGGTGISFDTAVAAEVVNGSSTGYDQAVGQVQASTTVPSSGNTGTLSGQPALGLALSFNTNFGSITPAAGSGFTDDGAISNGGMTGRLEDKRVTATTAFSGDFTSTSSTFTTIMVVILEASGGPATSTDQSALVPATARPRQQTRVAAQASQPTGPLTPFVSPSTGWMVPESRTVQPSSRKVEPSQPFGTVTPAALAALGWLTADYRPNPVARPRALESQQPTGPLVPFVSLSVGWIVVPTKSPTLHPSRPEPSAPTGPLTPFVSLSFGWASAEQRRAPPFRPRALYEQRPLTTFLPPLGNLGWLMPDGARARARLTRRQTPSEPVGVRIVPAGLVALGPFWYLDSRPHWKQPAAWRHPQPLLIPAEFPAVYTQAPDDRYIWAPPDVRASVFTPIEPAVTVEPDPSPAVWDESITLAVFGPDEPAAFDGPDERAVF